MAALAAQQIVAYKLFDPSRIQLITFGEPRVGNAAFAGIHDNLVQHFERGRLFQVPNSIRVTHHRDVVPHIPPQSLSSYKHHATEVFLSPERVFRCGTTTT